MAKKLSIQKTGNFSGLSSSDILKKNKILETQLDELKQKSFRIIPLSGIKQEEPFESLFPIEEKVFQGILSDMQKNGFDQSKPIDIWNGIVIDGNTRFKAASQAGITEVPVFEHTFKNTEEALEYAVHNQRDRRNITDAEIYKHVQLFDEVLRRGGDHTTESGKAKASSGAIGKSSQLTAEKIGISSRKVEKARTIQKQADESTIDAVKKGKLSINKAYNQVREKRKGKVGLDKKKNSQYNLEITITGSGGVKKKYQFFFTPDEMEIRITKVLDIFKA